MEIQQSFFINFLWPSTYGVRLLKLLITYTLIGILGFLDLTAVECRHRELETAQFQIGIKNNLHSSSFSNDETGK